MSHLLLCANNVQNQRLWFLLFSSAFYSFPSQSFERPRARRGPPIELIVFDPILLAIHHFKKYRKDRQEKE